MAGCHFAWSEEKVPSAEAEGTIVREINYFRLSSTATATLTVIPTMGLLPAPRKPIIST
jgi:hypothetical protein